MENKSIVLMRNLTYSSFSFYLPFLWFLREVMFVGQYQFICYRQIYDFLQPGNKNRLKGYLERKKLRKMTDK